MSEVAASAQDDVGAQCAAALARLTSLLNELAHTATAAHPILLPSVRAAAGPQIAIAFSGGLDSRFLAHAARLAGLDPLLLHADGPHVPRAESQWAVQWAEQGEFRLHVVHSDPLSLPAVAHSAQDRCYHCKRALFSRLQELTPGLPLCDGSNASDSQLYRPGMRAVQELGVHSPLAQVGLSKAQLRTLGRATGFDRPDQRPRPCLLTRLPYGMPVNPALLAALEQAEEAITHILMPDPARVDAVPDFRVRLTTPTTLELHMDAPPSPDMLRQLEELLLPGLPPLHVVILDTVSGYFDGVRQDT